MSSVSYFSSSNSSRILQELHNMLGHQELCDVLLETDDALSIRGHRNILSAASPYFRAMFTGSLIESQKKKIILRDVDGKALEQIVQFIYSSTICVTDNNVESVLNAANLFQIKEVENLCCQFLKEQLHPSNCLGIRALADRFSCEELFSEAHKFTVKHFNEVVLCDEFKSLSFEEAKTLLSDENICVRSEEDVFEAAIKWLKACDKRNMHTAEVMGCVRLPVLSPGYLEAHVTTNCLLQSDPDCKQMLEEAILYASSPSSEKRKYSQVVRMQPRIPSGFADIMVAVGGLYLGDAVASAESYNLYTDEWHRTPNMNTGRYGIAVTHLNGIVYCLGGYERGRFLNTVECFDPEENTWTLREPMHDARKYFGAACLFGKIYTAGGSTGQRKLNSLECYDPYENSWSYLAPMSCPRMYLGVASLGGLLYAVGGHNGISRLNTAECYDPQTNQWTSIAPMGKNSQP